MNRTFAVRDLCLCALFTALLAVCAWITVPTPVPFTLQSFGVFITFLLLGGKRGTVTVAAYLVLGFVGIPLFSGFRGGIGVLFDATGGYLIGFLSAAFLYWLINPRTPRRKLLTLLLGQVLVYLFGTAWFAVLYIARAGTAGLTVALLWCVLPFLLPDGVKLWFALFVAKRLQKEGLPL